MKRRYLYATYFFLGAAYMILYNPHSWIEFLWVIGLPAVCFVVFPLLDKLIVRQKKTV